jgi:regulator of sigma E protease
MSGGGVYLIGILGLLMLVFIHELGHFVAARAVGMKPSKFYLGFPPAMVRKVRNGIEYGIGVIPLGGYVKIPGMFRPSERDAERSFGPLAADHPELEPFVEDIRTALRRNDERALLDGLDVFERRVAALDATSLTRLAMNGIEELRDGASPHAYWRQATWRRIVAIAAGPAANILTAILVLTAVNVIGVRVSTSLGVDKVLKGSPAQKGGVEAGDTLIQLGNTVVKNTEQAHTIIQNGHGRGVVVVVNRAGQRIVLGTIRPRKTDGAYLIGIEWSAATRKDSVPRALARSTAETWNVASQIVTGLPKLIHPQQRKQVSSVVGIVHVSGEALRTDYRDYLAVIALISISLGVLNLLPFLPLDGGHILVALVERARRRPLRRELVERFSLVGFAVVGLMMYVGLSNDVHRYF